MPENPLDLEIIWIMKEMNLEKIVFHTQFKEKDKTIQKMIAQALENIMLMTVHLVINLHSTQYLKA